MSSSELSPRSEHLHQMNVPLGCLPVVILFSLGIFVSSSSAQDRLVLRGTTSGRIIITGTVTEFIGQKITVTSAGGDSSRLYDATDLLEIQTMQVAPQQRAIKALATGQSSDALR